MVGGRGETRGRLADFHTRSGWSPVKPCEGACKGRPEAFTPHWEQIPPWTETHDSEEAREARLTLTASLRQLGVAEIGGPVETPVTVSTLGEGWHVCNPLHDGLTLQNLEAQPV